MQQIRDREDFSYMKWEFDVYHSSVTFTIRHMMSKVRGQMRIKEGWIEVDNAQLRSAEGHFAVANYPTIPFKSKRVEGKDPANFKVIGDLTIHGKTREVALDASFNGEGKDPRGNRRVSFEAQTKLNRKDYDLTWNQALQAGGFILGDDVKLEIGVEAVPAPTPAEAETEIEAEVALESR